ncbi:MAG: endopeptidase La [Saprospiraceae bacterium]|nr:endopeptidase La [Saprospiraceae bacterium]
MFDQNSFRFAVQEEIEFPLMTTEEEEEPSRDTDDPEILGILPLKNTVQFPGIVLPITISRDKSIQAVNQAYREDKRIVVITQKEQGNEDPNFQDLFRIGTIARILKVLKMPDGTTTAILQGRKRVRILDELSETPILKASVTPLIYKQVAHKLEFEALVATIKDLAKRIIDLSPHIPGEAATMLRNINDDGFLLNFIASNLGVNLTQRQQLLEMNDLPKKGQAILEYMHKDLQLLELKEQIESKVRGDIEKQQRDYFLNQQLKTIQDELGQNPHEDELKKLATRGAEKKWPKSAKDTFERELGKLRRSNPQMAEYGVVLNYVEFLLDLPWEEYTKDNFDLKKVKAVLDKDHFGLDDVKERIIEHLAVLKLKGDMKSPIICLVGPPGVGKTSLGKSVAKALKRKFIRMSLGGLHDEAEIRGHRKTYIGALPGRILQSIKKSTSSNPVFILDEIDKLGKDFRGDPSSALLEVLDPEQNSTFYDNYLELEYDLSKVLFIATANSIQNIQPALLDRMEIIELSGYSTEEKIEIAKRHLIPKQLDAHGLKPKHIKWNDEVLAHVIDSYTRESGVRALDRQIAGLMRRVAKEVAMKSSYTIALKKTDVVKMIGMEKINQDIYQDVSMPGVAIGLAWTRVGGDILYIESSLSKGKGKLTLTGNLGDVMKESATTALSFVKSKSKQFGIDDTMFEQNDVHIHIPEGAIPKDGPSAGITMLTTLVSAFTRTPVKPHLAMSGEITLRGKVLPVGGIKEKVLAAKRAGIKEIILCRENERDVKEIKPEYIQGLQFKYVDRMEEVVGLAI